MEKIEIRPFCPILEIEALLVLWNRIFPHDSTTLFDLNELIFCGEGLDLSLCLLAWKHKQMVGFVCAVVDDSRHDAYIHAIGVDDCLRNSGIGTRMLDTLENELSRRSIRKLIFSGYPNRYILPGLDDNCYPTGKLFLESKGFVSKTEVVSMEKFLVTVQTSEIELSDLFKVIPFSDRFLGSVLQLSRRMLHPEWVDTIRQAYIRTEGNCHGYVCVDMRGIVVGYAFFGMVGEDICRFGPIGVDTAYRGKSIGKALLLACLHEQQKLGCSRSYFLWGEKKSPAVKMYSKAGFTVFRTMTIYEKLLNR